MESPKPSPDATTKEHHYRPALAVAERWKWLAPGLLMGLCVYVAYLSTHRYPAFGAGLFLEMAEQSVAHPSGIPSTIPGYTERGIPFAYPPLMFYLNGLLIVGLGVDPLVLTRHLPPLMSLVALVPFYLFAEELLASRRRAGVATALVALAPPVLQWQISGGGIVRGPAYLFTVIGLYAGLKLFRDGQRQWLVPSILAFTFTVLTHPVYTVFFGLTYLWMYACWDRTLVGLRDGGAVAAGGILLSAPWWARVALDHGFGVFTGAAGTHGGIGKRLPDLFALFVPGKSGNVAPVLFGVQPALFDFTSFGMTLLTAWGILYLLAWFALLLDGDVFLSGWALLAITLVSKPRFPFAIGSLIAAVAYYRFVVPRLGLLPSAPSPRNAARVALTIALVGATFATGVSYAGSALDSHAGSESLPQFIDEEDREAMEWAATNTHPSAEFVVMGDAAEWFPYFTDRTILVGPWGVEWRGRASYERQLESFNRLSTCEDAACLTWGLVRAGATPDYVYVPKGEYTVRGMQNTMDPQMEQTLLASERYAPVYENEGVLVVAYRGGHHCDSFAGDQPAGRSRAMALADCANGVQGEVASTLSSPSRDAVKLGVDGATVGRLPRSVDRALP